MLTKWLIIPDTHVPFHDVKAFRLMLRAARAIQARNVVILGDFADCYSVSSHPKDPRREQNHAKEIEAVKTALDEVEAVCKGQRIYVEGNHELRSERYTQERAPALSDTVSLRKDLGLTQRGWRVIGYRDHVKIGRLFLTHDIGKVGRAANVDAMNAFQGNVVIGHTHRMAYNVEGSARGKTHVGAMFGWLGDFGSLDYMHRIRAQRDWVHGFGLAYVEPNGNAHLVPCPIVDGKVLVEGRLIR